MKYIRTVREDGKEELFTFPRSINHDDFYRAILDVRTSDGVHTYRKAESAGFVNRKNECHGRSETLNFYSSDGDSLLLEIQKLANGLNDG